MGSTGRSRNNPLGRADSIACQKGNILACRALVLMILCAAKGIFWCLEQPSSSCMEWHPLFQQLLRLVSVRKFQFRMSKFGAPTPKRTILYSSNLPTKQWFQVYTVWVLFFVTVSKTLARVERVENFPPPAFAGHRCISQIMDFTVPEKLKEREMVVKYRSKSGKARFHGGSQLKSSQSYPAGSMAANKC